MLEYPDWDLIVLELHGQGGLRIPLGLQTRVTCTHGEVATYVELQGDGCAGQLNHSIITQIPRIHLPSIRTSAERRRAEGVDDGCLRLERAGLRARRGRGRIRAPEGGLLQRPGKPLEAG